MRQLAYVGNVKKIIGKWPAQARERTLVQFQRLQDGLDPQDWKPMKTVAAGVREIRLHAEGEWRVVYIAKLEDAIYILHAFQKKTGATPKADIELARQRLKAINSR